jgi:hypothetical protein
MMDMDHSRHLSDVHGMTRECAFVYRLFQTPSRISHCDLPGQKITQSMMTSAKLQKLSALLGLLSAFLVADKSPQVDPNTNLKIVKTYKISYLIYDFLISLRHESSNDTNTHIF